MKINHSLIWKDSLTIQWTFFVFGMYLFGCVCYMTCKCSICNIQKEEFWNESFLFFFFLHVVYFQLPPLSSTLITSFHNTNELLNSQFTPLLFSIKIVSIESTFLEKYVVKVSLGPTFWSPMWGIYMRQLLPL